MAELTPFIIETAVVNAFNVGALILSIWQVYHDISQEERMRPLVACHYLILVACSLTFFQYFDSQGGLGLYSVATAKLITNFKGLFILAGAHALATGFIESHQVVTEGIQREQEYKVAKVLYPLFFVFCTGVFIARCATHLAWLDATIVIITTVYNIVVGTLVIVSAFRVRRVLKEEFKRAGKYSEGIRKLTRLIILVVIILVVSDTNTIIKLPATIKQVSVEPILPDAQPTSFDMNHILSNVISIITLYALVMGGWNVKTQLLSKKTQVESQMTTIIPTSSSTPRRSTKSTPRTLSQGRVVRSESSVVRSESSADIGTPVEPVRTLVETTHCPEPSTQCVEESLKPNDPEPELEVVKPTCTDDDTSSKRRRKRGGSTYQELCPV